MSDHPMEILLVEDNPNDVELTLHAFRKHNLTNHVKVVRDGAEALDYLFRDGAYESRPDVCPKVVLLDLKLPKIDGLEVLRRMRQDPRTRHVPVVVLTSSYDERDVIESYNVGANSYIVKPVDFVQFTEAMRTLNLYWLLLNRSPSSGTPAPTPPVS
jgi:two-component system response regulator